MLAGLKQIMEGVAKRNAYIAKIAIEQKDDMAIVIGQAHLHGLAEEFAKNCTPNEKPEKPSGFALPGFTR